MLSYRETGQSLLFMPELWSTQKLMRRTQLGQHLDFICQWSMVMKVLGLNPACICYFSSTVMGNGHQAGLISWESYFQRLQDTLRSSSMEWQEMKMFQFQWRGQKQKLVVEVRRFSGRACQSPSFSSRTAFFMRRISEKSTYIVILLVTLRKISQLDLSSSHKGPATSYKSRKSTSFDMVLAVASSHFLVYETLTSRSMDWSLRLKVDILRICRSEGQYSKINSLKLEGERVQQLVTAGSRRRSVCFEDAMIVKWVKKDQQSFTFTTETMNYSSLTKSFSMKMQPSALCYEDSSSNYYSLETNNFNELRGAIRLKLTSDFFSSLNLKSILSQWLSIVQLNGVPSVSQMYFYSSSILNQNYVFSKPSTLIWKLQSSLASQTKGWWQFPVLSLHFSLGTGQVDQQAAYRIVLGLLICT